MERELAVEQTNPPKRSPKKTILAGVAGVLVLAGIGTAYAKWDMFKSPKTIYLEAEANNLAELSASWEKTTDWYEQEIQPYLDNPAHSTMELSDVTVDGQIADPQAQQLLSLLRQTKLTLDSSLDPKKQQEYANINLFVKGQNVIGLETFQDKQKVGFGVPEIYPKYALIDLANREALKEKLGIDQLPKRFVTYRDILNAVKIGKDELSEAVLPYAKLYADNLTDQQVTMKSDATFQQGSFTTPAREITVTFTHDQLKALATQLADKAAADDKLFDLLYSRYHNLTALMIDSGYSDLNDLPKEEAKAEYKKALEDFKQNLQSDAAKGGLKLILQIDSSDHILSRKIIPVEENGKENGSIASASWTDNGEENCLLAFTGLKSDGESNDVNLSYKAKKQGNETKGTVAFSVASQNGSKKPAAFDFRAQFAVTKDDGKETGTYDFSTKADDPAADEHVAFSGKISTQVLKSDKKRETEASVKLDFAGMQSPDLPKGISFQLKGANELVNEIKLPALTKDNSIDLAALSDEQMAQIEQEIGAGFQQFMMKNMSLLQELGALPQP